jgi:hypothetical protein
MKKIAFIFSIFVYGIVLGQVPQKLSYQAVIRDASNNIVSNQPVGIRISIIQGSPTGTPVYIETHNPMTNTDGLVSIEIAGGVVISGAFSGIDWSKAPYFLFTEVDPTGGMSYSIFSTTELMSVPYALYAEKSRNPGPAGPQGVQGPAGANGANGVGINNAQIINDSLKLTLTNGNTLNVGYVKGPKGDTGIQGPAGVNGISMSNAQVINDSLKLTLTNGNIINAGYVKGTKGDTGISITNVQIINDSLKVALTNGSIINAGKMNSNIINTHGVFLDTTKSILKNWVVPQNVSQINVVLVGARGGNGGTELAINQSTGSQAYINGGSGGTSAYISFLLNVSFGDTIKYFLGSNGIDGQNTTCNYSSYSGFYPCCYNSDNGTNGIESLLYIDNELIARVNGGSKGDGGKCVAWNGVSGGNGSRGTVEILNEFHPKTIYLNSNNTTLISNNSRIIIRY